MSPCSTLLTISLRMRDLRILSTYGRGRYPEIDNTRNLTYPSGILVKIKKDKQVLVAGDGGRLLLCGQKTEPQEIEREIFIPNSIVQLPNAARGLVRVRAYPEDGNGRYLLELGFDGGGGKIELINPTFPDYKKLLPPYSYHPSPADFYGRDIVDMEKIFRILNEKGGLNIIPNGKRPALVHFGYANMCGVLYPRPDFEKKKHSCPFWYQEELEEGNLPSLSSKEPTSC